jgi:hypothetical protein
VVAVVAILSIRAYRQHATAETFSIRAANGIDEAMYVTIGGIEQWIQIRGRDRNRSSAWCRTASTSRNFCEVIFTRKR